jgi:hypothetical protein
LVLRMGYWCSNTTTDKPSQTRRMPSPTPRPRHPCICTR